MEKRTEYLFYIGIQSEDEHHKAEYQLVPRAYLQFHKGQMVVYGYFIPEELVKPSGKRFGWQRKRQEKQRTHKLLAGIRAVTEGLKNELHGERIRFFCMADEVTKRLSVESGFWQESDREELVDRLCEVYLYRERKTNRDTTLSLSLPKECGELAVMRLMAIAEPYLQRINRVLYVGAKDGGAGMLEEYLYEEYGIIMTYGKYPQRGTIWIDLEDAENQNLSKYAKENGICHINRAEVLKFLDTAVKNGYNTKVN